LAPRFSTYLYPWDFARLGVSEVLDDLQSWSVQGVHLAANYHQISAVSPRGQDLRVFFAPRGGVFFPARAERYGRIRPSVWPDHEVSGVWREVARQVEARSMVLTAWTIAMFQPWMAQDYPFAARVSATGDRTDAGVCPNSPDVQEYLANLAVDLSEQFDVRGFALEGNVLPPYDYGWIRPRMFTRLTSLAQRLLRLCFCENCQGLALARGLDPQALGQRVRSLLRQRGVQSDVRGSDDELGDDEEIEAYELLGSLGAEAVVRAMSTALCEHGSGAGVIVAAPGTDVGGRGARLPEVVDSISGIRLFGAGALPEQQAFLRNLRDAAPHLVTEVMLHPPMLAGMPIITASDNYQDEHFLREYADAIESGVDWAGVYHYGLLDEERFARTMNILGVRRA
jgi:hypothetical protein